MTLPGDELLPGADVVSTRAVAVAAPAEQVWPWLVQLGWGRAGWYSIDAVERVVGAARSVDATGEVSWRSLREVVPAHQKLAVGDVVPLHRDIGLRVTSLAENRHLVLSATFGHGAVRLDWVWTFALLPRAGGCRLVARTRTAATPRLPGMLLQHVLLDPGHAIMEIAQLRGVRDRAERA